MFNFPTNIRLPGFRVGQTDDDETDTQTGDSTPRFAVPPLGCDSSGKAIQAAPAIQHPTSFMAVRLPPTAP